MKNTTSEEILTEAIPTEAIPTEAIPTEENTYEMIARSNIIQYRAYDSDTSALNRYPLCIASSGGQGHIMAMKAIIHHLFHDITLPIYTAPPYEEHSHSLLDYSIMSASYLNNLSLIQQLSQNSGLPVLPNQHLLKHALKQLIASNLEPKPYIDMALDVCQAYQATAVWNALQTSDQTSELEKLIHLQTYHDEYYHRIIYGHFLALLNQAYLAKKPYSEIICTQVLGLKALCQAVNAYNRLNNCDLVIHQYFTDLPTASAIHFFQPLQALTQEEQLCMKLYGLNLRPDIIEYFFHEHRPLFKGLYAIQAEHNPMIRPGFYDTTFAYHERHHENITLPLELDIEDQKIIQANEIIGSIMLGSQASLDTLKYIETVLEYMDRIFILGGKNLSIQTAIQQLYQKQPHLSQSIVLLPPQNDYALMALMTRSNLVIIRAGGLSIMEQISMPHHAKQIIMIHHGSHIGSCLTSGILWEDANANACIRELKAQNITVLKTSPSIVQHQLSEYFERKINEAEWVHI